MAKAQLTVGMTIDGFLLQERIHRGGMADIWRVRRGDINFPIIMKVPLLDFEGDISVLVGFEVEQMIMAEVTGLHVPRWIANGEFAVQPYIVMEYIDGPTLLKMWADRVAPADEIVQIGIEMAAALADLHQQHVLHLDLKPANIMFRPTGEAVLIDFGLSRHEQLPDLLEEQFHRPTGTPDYMAPEQLFRVRSDKRSDIYAFGAVLYQLATGHLPFGRPTRMRKVRRRVWRDPVPPRTLRPHTPPVLQEIILRCLEPLPDARYQSATDLLFELRHLDLVELTERARRTQQSDFRTVLGRRLRAPKTIRTILASATRPPVRPPIILAAVDLRAGLEDLRQALLEAAASVLANTPGARLACVSILPTSLIGVDENVDAAGENIHVQKLAELRSWAQPLQLPRGKVSYHLLESRNVTAAILDFARSNTVDHIVIGAARTGSIVGKVAAQITAEAPCSVTVVRAGDEGSHGQKTENAGPSSSGLPSI
jgi:non-specific serine/threonine protein kinase/protein-serine/threonine kinase